MTSRMTRMTLIMKGILEN
ncbi:unnamed protein product [Acanthoscelides obtectus]|uniref:Uncharacterized protein n=1 Tax=Acanthoscelides obtectus TaxID=200917 RepID=A0A9P0QCR6_ACAOB|nr:unnamed protein product [Acanthoscelides obtectus]CAK1657455.1 hypothetical protein AOBTE_LOCUS20351 [Acanthoscelides obtectus]